MISISAPPPKNEQSGHPKAENLIRLNFPFFNQNYKQKKNNLKKEGPKTSKKPKLN